MLTLLVSFNRKTEQTSLSTIMINKLFFFVSICCLAVVFLSAQPAVTAHNHVLPQNLGEIVFQTERDADSRVYIVANSHRSERTSRNGKSTLQAQIETYRIGEWLINQGAVELLLPEGFFGTRDQRNSVEGRLLDCTELSTRLADTTRFVNAELLLRESFGIGMQQVEDRQLYRQIRDQLRLGQQLRYRLSEEFSAQLKELQRRRTAAIMQNIPAAIETAYRQGDISAPAAMLTIGLSHLDDFLLFLEAGEIQLAAQHPFPALSTELELLRKNVDVTVIVPNSLLAWWQRGSSSTTDSAF